MLHISDAVAYGPGFCIAWAHADVIDILRVVRSQIADAPRKVPTPVVESALDEVVAMLDQRSADDIALVGNDPRTQGGDL